MPVKVHKYNDQITGVIFKSGDVARLTGKGSPEGVATAAPGSTYQRQDGGSGTTFYVKESGTGSTGWTAFGAGGGGGGVGSLAQVTAVGTVTTDAVTVGGLTVNGAASTTGNATIGGAASIAGLLTAGSGTVILTDATGHILPSAMNTVDVAHGGTGATTFTAGSLLSGNGTSAVSAVSLGTGLTMSAGFLSANMTLAQVTGNGTTTAFPITTGGLTAVGSITASGTITAGSGPTTLTDATGKILSAALNTVGVAQGGTGATGFSTGALLIGNGSSAISTVTVGSGLQVSGGVLSVTGGTGTVGGTGTADTLPLWQVGGANLGDSALSQSSGNLTASGDFTASGLLKAGSGPTTLTDASGKVLSASLNTVAVAQGGTGVTSFTSGALVGGNGSSALSAVTVGDGLSLSGGVLTATGIAGTGIGGSGTQNTLALFSNAPGTSIGNSALTQSGTTVTASNDLTVSGTLRAGTTPTALTDTAGKVLAAALNTVDVPHGGTGATTFTSGALVGGNGTSALSPVTVGTGLLLSGGTLSATTTGVGGSGTQNLIPVWNNAGGTSLGNSPITVSGSNLTTSGSLRVGTTLTAGSAPTTLTDSVGKVLSAALNTVQVAQGGTGAISFTAGTLIGGNGSSALSVVTVGSGLSLSGGVLSATGVGGGSMGGSGTTNTVAMFTGTSAVGNSPITISGSLVQVAQNGQAAQNIQTQTVFNVKDYGAKGDAVQVRIQLSGGTATAVSGTGTLDPTRFTTANYANYWIQIPNAVATTGITFDLAASGAYTAVSSTNQQLHIWNQGCKISVSGHGFAPGTVVQTTPADIPASSETGWHALCSPLGTSLPATGVAATLYTPLYGKITSIASGIPTLTSTNGTLSSSASWTETAWLGYDDTAAFQSAVNAAASVGGTVVVPAGTYYIKGLTLASNVTVECRPGATFVMIAGSVSPTNDFNTGGTSTPQFVTATGTLGLDDPQMAQWTGSSASPVVPCSVVSGGSLSANTTYYYRVSGVDASGNETALSSTMNFATTDNTNKTVQLSVLKNASVTSYRVWRSDGVNANTGAFTWKLWRTVAVGAADEWTDSNTNTLALLDDGTTAPTAAVPQSVNQTYAPVKNIRWSGGTFNGNNGASAAIYVTYGQDIHIDGLQASQMTDAGIELRAVNTGTVTRCRLDGGAHGAVIWDCQHVTVSDSVFSNNSVNGLLVYHSQTFSVASWARSTGHPFGLDVRVVRSEITNYGQDYGAHAQAIIFYGVQQALASENFIHDSLSSGTAQAIRFRDSEGKCHHNRILNPAGPGIKIDAIGDFSDQIINGDDNTIANDRVLIGGNVEVVGNRIEKAQTYAIYASNATATLPTGSSGVLSGSFSSLAPGNTTMAAISTVSEMNPVQILYNSILNTGYDDLSQSSDAIQCALSHSRIEGNKITNVANGGIISAVNQPGGVTYQPTGIQFIGNHVRNVGQGSNSDGTYKKGIYSLGIQSNMASNTFLNDTSLSGSTAITVGTTTASAPWNTLDYSSASTGNLVQNYATSTSYVAAAGHTSTSLSTV